MRPRAVIADYGIGNLLSVARALVTCGAAVSLSRDAASVAAADRLVVPGVGAFGDCMAALRQRGLDEAVRAHAASGRPWLGICVGMQMMLNASEEFGAHSGLGLIAGRCRPIPPTGLDGRPHKVPHIGWSALAAPPARADWSGTILEGTVAGTAVYFVHSFAAEPDHRVDRLADVDYDGLTLAAVLARDNLVGTQFHPEKSGPAGLRILDRFLAL